MRCLSRPRVSRRTRRFRALAEITSFDSITPSVREASRLAYRVVGQVHSRSKDAKRSASMNRSRSWGNMKG